MILLPSFHPLIFGTLQLKSNTLDRGLHRNYKETALDYRRRGPRCTNKSIGRAETVKLHHDRFAGFLNLDRLSGPLCPALASR